ncbi:hypothetical protein COV19_01795 [Candidatus Woesearchaeota archaeon CG10_big_fil_rev_8_21_14_0_10_44_13]|nr:MAG: hypothetical protein COV19_01795 [Candidatus Woesearchaeota archaeon CG10_big_fil_rev_8_21_14_0_10_44_13]
MTGKNEEIIKEVLDEIESSLKDPKGIAAHQRRLAFLLSLGVVSIIEDYLQRRVVLKSGAKINHLWLKKKKENAKTLISKQITCQIDSLEKIDGFLETAYSLEKERNSLAYGKKVSDDELKEKISQFLKFKKEAENA